MNSAFVRLLQVCMLWKICGIMALKIQESANPTRASCMSYYVTALSDRPAYFVLIKDFTYTYYGS